MTGTPNPALATPRHSTGFDAALVGRARRLVRADGAVVPLPVDRWHDIDADDSWLLDRCSGPTLDLGCGPGRLVVALAGRGIIALGVDVSAEAVRCCRARGAAVLHGDALDSLPGEGRWDHVLLADGNIGIGGDPVQLLRRCRMLLRGTGTVLVELDPAATVWRGMACLEGDGGSGAEAGSWFPWATLGPADLDAVAARAGLVVTARMTSARCFAELAPAGRAGDPVACGGPR